MKLQKAIREVSKGECVIMCDFNNGYLGMGIIRECWR